MAQPLYDPFPSKLLGLPEAEHIAWPETFAELGKALRLDYSTTIHSARQGKKKAAWQPFRHRFATGVSVYAPSRHAVAEGLRAGERSGARACVLEEAIRPVVMGVADRLYFIARDGRQVIMAREGIGIDERDADEDFIEADLPPSYFCWDVEERQLIVMREDGEVEFVLRGGLMQLDERAMICG